MINENTIKMFNNMMAQKLLSIIECYVVKPLKRLLKSDVNGSLNIERK